MESFVSKGAKDHFFMSRILTKNVLIAIHEKLSFSFFVCPIQHNDLITIQEVEFNSLSSYFEFKKKMKKTRWRGA